MRKLALIFFALSLSASSVAVAQEITPADREKLRQAEKVADTFVERFRQTLNFGAVWKEFRAELFSCRLVKSDLITSVSDEEKLKLGTALLERAYVALMNYYYLKGVHDLSVARMDSGKTEEQITPKEILKAENSSVYMRTNGKSPKTVKEIEENIIELNRLAKLYRKYMTRNVMRSAAWRANNKYLTSRGGVTHLGVNRGHPDFCIPDDVKYYIVGRGVFYFYMVEENGRMKVVELAVGD
jgi:hypothetical protein